jgi:nitroreductase
MDTEQAIRTRRTHKAFGPEPIYPRTLDELLELARWAPNHKLTIPWRFHLLGPRSLSRLKDAAGPGQAEKLSRAPTLVLVSALLTGDPLQDDEDVQAASVAAYIVLLAAHARGLAGYWRTPEVLRTDAGRAALLLPDQEQVIGLIHLGRPRQDREPPARPEPASYIRRLD